MKTKHSLMTKHFLMAKHSLMFDKFFFERKTFYGQPTQLNYQTLTAEDIRNMPMDQYVELRERLIPHRRLRKY